MMFPLPITGWIAIGAAVAVLGLGMGLKVQTSRLDAAKAEIVAVQGKFDAFVAQAKAAGEEQAARAKAMDESNAKLKEEADAKLTKSKSDLAGMYAAYRKLRDSRESAGGGTVSSLPVSAIRPDRICFDRAKFAGAVGSLESGVSGIAQEGDGARLRLATAAEWARSLSNTR